jgi:hypothetical protein
MTTVLFIHGTGVRKDDFDDTYREVERRLLAMRPGINIRPCYWGEIGARLEAGGNSFYFDPPQKPQKDGKKGKRPLTVAQLDQETQRALWRRLLDDPLFEVRLRRSRPPGRAARQSGPRPTAADRVAVLPANPELGAQLAARGLAAAFGAAVGDIAGAREFVRAFGQADVLDGNTMDMFARALAARCLAAADDDGAVASDRLEDLAALIRQALGPPDQGISVLTDPLKALAGELAMQAADPWLWKFRRATISMLGDILLYQGRGDEIREFIRDKISEIGESDGPVVLLAHSLGGVMAFDLLAGTERDGLGNVEMLVTAGSQVPLLYELRALRCGVNYPDPVPDRFTATWLNFYDESDLLSYAGEDLFYPRCTDCQLDTGRPFPKAHGAYWRADKFYERLNEALDKEDAKRA